MTKPWEETWHGRHSVACSFDVYCDTEPRGLIFVGGDQSEPEAEGRAKLAGAAPELYRALAHILDISRGETEGSPALVAAQAALKKARGEP